MNKVLLCVILYIGNGPTVAYYCKTVWRLCIHLVYIYIYVTLGWDKLDIMEIYLFNIICYYTAIV